MRQKIIKDIINNDSNFGILAEESGMLSEESYKYLWVIDPLDGTANYSRNIPLCCVSIAILSANKPVLGVIYDFNNDELYEGSINTSACLNGQQYQFLKTKKPRRCFNNWTT